MIRPLLFLLILAGPAAGLAQPGRPTAGDPAHAQIAALEQQLGDNLVRRDFAALDRLLAPGFRLVVAGKPGERPAITRRDEWLRNSRAFTHHAYRADLLDLNRAGDTAVASARGTWTVTMRPGAPPRTTQFVVADTWVRRAGRWQLLHRYSQRLVQDAATSSR
jgi:hypothetical protein